MTEKYLFLDVEVRDGVAVATMQHPDYSHAERNDWVTLINAVKDDDDVRALVVTGWGNPKQGPVPGMFEDFDAYMYYERARLQPLAMFIDLDKPVVMAIDGNPGVMSIPLTGDILIGQSDLTFSDPHVLIGTSSATQPYLWPLNSGLLQAKKYILTGKSFDAAEALALGLLTEVVEPGQTLEKAMEYATHFASLRPETLQATKRVLNQWLRQFHASIFEPALMMEFMSFPKNFADRFKPAATSAADDDAG
ncbi:MAG TPA: enoyl-CoA hydratase-related protein [Ilumatobacteraceae bacterium]|nr:enoyl-CoA hydratase-related protein [Ilumatobacteraceae bacterium]